MTETIRTAIAAASAYLLEHRDQVRYTDCPAMARVEEGLRIRVEGSNGEVVMTDMPGGVGGGGSAPSPGWFLRASVAAYVTSLAVMRAAQLEIEGFTCEVEVDSQSDDYGILGLESSVPSGPLSMRIKIHVTAEGSEPDLVAEVAKWAVDHCPVSDAIRPGLTPRKRLLDTERRVPADRGKARRGVARAGGHSKGAHHHDLWRLSLQGDKLAMRFAMVRSDTHDHRDAESCAVSTTQRGSGTRSRFNPHDLPTHRTACH
ncbi:MAG TPA: OsmC family protein [Acidimicrobiia bacterium]|nr:OsmC family protein [Acidimicrobiia bacterium]